MLLSINKYSRSIFKYKQIYKSANFLKEIVFSKILKYFTSKYK